MRRLPGRLCQQRAARLLALIHSAIELPLRQPSRRPGFARAVDQLAREHPRFGYRRLHVLLRRTVQQCNHKRVQRVYREAGLTVKRIRRRRLTRSFFAPESSAAPNQEWAIDFASDAIAGGQRFRVFSMIDAFTGECLALETATSMPSLRVTRILQKVIATRGIPVVLRSDNGLKASALASFLAE